MSRFRFLIGAAGTGKSTEIYKTLTKRTVEEPQKKFFLFVPEQNTLKAQQELIRYSEVHGMLSLDVLSFSLLSFRVLEELGKEPPVLLDEVTASLMLRKALTEVKEDLTVYQEKTASAGLVARLRAVITEMSQYQITGETLSAYEKKAETPLLEAKLSDLRKIYTAYRALLDNGTGSGKMAASADLPGLLIENLPQSQLLKDAVLFFDGYTGFTPVQLAVLEQMAGQAESLTFSVTMPRKEVFRRKFHETDLFWFAGKTIENITEVCLRANAVHDPDLLLGEESGETGTGYGAAEELLSYGGKREVSVRKYADPITEIRSLAGELRILAVTGQLRYRSAAVAVSDLPVYREIIKREFADAGIPCFIDDKEPASGNPVIELIRAALLTIRDQYDYEDVVTYLKNPFVTAKEERFCLDLFDNLLRAAGVRGRKALSEDLTKRTYLPKTLVPYLSETEAYRKSHLEPLFSLHDSLKEGKTAEEKIVSLRKYLEDIKIHEKAVSEKDIRFLTLSEALLKRMEVLFGKEVFSMKDFSDMMEAGFSDMKAGLIPGTMDMVSVGDLRRSRFDDIDVLYIVGANDGLLPQTATGGGIFTDRERTELAGAGLVMAPDDRQDASIQRYYLYLCMNKPARKLIISYALRDRTGALLKPSSLLKGAEAENGKLYLSTEADLLRAYSELLRGEETKERNLVLQAVTDLLEETQHPDTAERFRMVRDASVKRETETKLDPDTASRLYGGELTGSVTRLEQYAACPFRHFASYGLRLAERETFDIEAADIGNIYHKALDGIFRSLREEKKTIGTVSLPELMEKAREITRKTAAGENAGLFTSSARNRYIAGQAERMMLRTVEMLSRQYQNGSFTVSGTEQRFNERENGANLTGRIDRIDTFTSGGKTYVKVIDYKSGAKEADLNLWAEGIELQLPAYLRAAVSAEAVKGKNALPAGMYTYHVQDPVISWEKYDERDKVFELKGLTLSDPDVLSATDVRLRDENGTSDIVHVKLKNGVPDKTSEVLSPEAFDALLEKNREWIRTDTEEILSGKIRVKPYLYKQKTACDYCPYHSVCGFDRKIPGTGYRKIVSGTREEVRRKLLGETGGEE